MIYNLPTEKPAKDYKSIMRQWIFKDIKENQ
jgi:hypothetical protein